VQYTVREREWIAAFVSSKVAGWARAYDSAFPV
jgi:hypothetical protein